MVELRSQLVTTADLLLLLLVTHKRWGKSQRRRRRERRGCLFFSCFRSSQTKCLLEEDDDSTNDADEAAANKSESEAAANKSDSEATAAAGNSAASSVSFSEQEWEISETTLLPDAKTLCRCPECPARFPDSDSLVAHYHSSHPRAAATRVRNRYGDGFTGFARRDWAGAVTDVRDSVRTTLNLEDCDAHLKDDQKQTSDSRDLFARELDRAEEEEKPEGGTPAGDGGGDDDDDEGEFEVAASIFAEGLKLLDVFGNGDDGEGGTDSSGMAPPSILAVMQDVEAVTSSLTSKTTAATLRLVNQADQATRDAAVGAVALGKQHVADVVVLDKNVRNVTSGALGKAKNLTTKPLNIIKHPSNGSRKKSPKTSPRTSSNSIPKTLNKSVSMAV